MVPNNIKNSTSIPQQKQNLYQTTNPYNISQRNKIKTFSIYCMIFINTSRTFGSTRLKYEAIQTLATLHKLILTIWHTKPLCLKFWKLDKADWLRLLSDLRQNETSDLQVHQISFTIRSNNKRIICVTMQNNYRQFIFNDSQNTLLTREINFFFTIFNWPRTK